MFLDTSIEGFWKARFGGLNRGVAMMPYLGWVNDCEHDEAFVPAQLTLRDGYDDLSQTVWLIGAPGAVGKSTLAKEIAAATGAIYLDLAQAATVAGNYMVGGLVYTNLLGAWTGGQVAILIDALDEARLRVTQSGFEAFLADVAAVSKMGKYPVIILGRVGIIEEAWAILNELQGLDAPIFDIELFQQDEAQRFVLARLNKLSKAGNAVTGEREYPDLAHALDVHASVYANAIQKVVVGLQELSTHDVNRFVGYAPVLDAVAKVIASQTNPSRIGDEMRRVLEGEVLLRLSSEVLKRETGKLTAQVANTMPGLPVGLYEPEEQLERLACHLLKLPPPAVPAQLTQHQVAAYEQAVQAMLPQHPFLDGSGRAPSSAVFAAAIVAAALSNARVDLVKAAEGYASSAQHTPNPFLFDFYLHSATAHTSMPAEHIGLVFESVLAKSKPGDTVRLNVEGTDTDVLSVEITIDRVDQETTRFECIAPNSGTIRLGRRVAGVAIDADETAVELGAGDQLELIGPVSISARSLELRCDQMVIKADSQALDGDTVTLEAAELLANPAIAAPVVRQGARLQVAWPNSASYPWTTFTGPSIQEEDPRTSDALRALRRLTMAFRSHSKGQLARFKDKIEHARMLKGPVGSAVLDKLLRDGVIRLEGAMYYLDPDKLGTVVGTSFLEVKMKNYANKTKQYVQQLDA